MYIVHPGQYAFKRLLEQLRTETDSADDYVAVRDVKSGMITARRKEGKAQLSPGALRVRTQE